MKLSSRIILALDETNEERAIAVAKEVSGIVDGIKINYPLVLSCGLGVVKKISPHGEVLCDLKIADVPHINKLIVTQAIDAGAEGVICHGFVGKDSVEACVDAARSRDVYVVAEMSHPGGMTFFPNLAEKIAKVAVEARATGVVAPATRPERIAFIRSIVGSLKIISPGVGAQGGSPTDAIKAGADYIIVGRSIYGAQNPRKEAEKVADAVKALKI